MRKLAIEAAVSDEVRLHGEVEIRKNSKLNEVKTRQHSHIQEAVKELSLVNDLIK